MFTVDSYKELNNKADEAKRGICILGIAYYVFRLNVFTSFFAVIRFEASVTKREQHAKNNSCIERVHTLVQWIILLTVSKKKNNY